MAGRTNKIYKSSQRYLRELRRAPEPRKRRWLIVSSTLAMLLVLGLWVIYLNLTLPTLPPVSANATTTEPATTGSQGESFFETFGRGLQITAGNLGQKLQDLSQTLNDYFTNLKNQIQKTNNIEIQPPANAFAPNPLENVPTTTLP